MCTLVAALIACANVIGRKCAQKHGVRFSEVSATIDFRLALSLVADACVHLFDGNDLRPLNRTAAPH